MKEHYDVIVGGGGAAGVASAIGASRTGARTLLIERGPCLGGAATMRNVLTYCGIYTNEDPPRQVVYGVAEEVLAALRAEGAVTGPQRFTAPAVVFDPEALKRVLDELCAAASVEVRLDSQIIAAHRDDGRISSVQVADHAGVHELTADAFVDATGEADLASFAGASVRYGNDGMVQNGSLGVRFGGVPAGVDLSKARVKQAVRAARVQGVGPLISEQGLFARLPISGTSSPTSSTKDTTPATPVRSAGRRPAPAASQRRTCRSCAPFSAARTPTSSAPAPSWAPGNRATSWPVTGYPKTTCWAPPASTTRSPSAHGRSNTTPAPASRRNGASSPAEAVSTFRSAHCAASTPTTCSPRAATSTATEVQAPRCG
jgi:hypothetical protein